GHRQRERLRCALSQPRPGSPPARLRTFGLDADPPARARARRCRRPAPGPRLDHRFPRPQSAGRALCRGGRPAPRGARQPARLRRAYADSASTLNLLRALARGGYADLRRVHGWTTDFVARSPQGERYAEVAGRITEALAFFDACGFNAMHSPQFHEVEFFT